ncbi:MAG: DNA primase DnaG [Candidatus Nanoarchaeia archaeon]|nr:DNA primase DnaG [Candidatus Nanoarchaeia archaeon]
MAKISPVSIKYMIHANFSVEGFLEKPDVIGALFGQTEGLLGSDLEMRELQKEGKIGRIEVELEKKEKRTTGKIQVPTALDQSETALIAAAIETIERIGPCDAQIEVEKIEDVRGSKREYIVDRAKKLMKELQGETSSREISTEIRSSTRAADITEYGEDKLPSGDLSGNEIIVVEGRADVINLMRNGVNNVVAMNGTKLPKAISDLSLEKEITLFVDGDRGGKLIVQNVIDNARIHDIAVAPSGKEVEELAGKEILQALRKKMSVKEFLSLDRSERTYSSYNQREENRGREEKEIPKTEIKFEINEEKLEKVFNRIKGSGKAVILDENLDELREVSVRGLGASLRRANDARAIVVDGTATSNLIMTAEEAGCKVVVAKNFTTTDTKIKLMSF